MELDKLAKVEVVSILFTGSKAERVVERATGWKNVCSKNLGVVASQIDWQCLWYRVTGTERGKSHMLTE